MKSNVLTWNKCKQCSLDSRHGQGYDGDIDNCQVLFVGMSYGRDEAMIGKPFQGRSGKLLRSLIKKATLESGVAFGNVVSCQPPLPRTKPTKHEVACCYDNLECLIKHCKPKVIVALGEAAIQRLIKGGNAKELRGRVIETKEYGKVIPTFHPAFILRSPQMECYLFEHIKIAVDVLNDKHNHSNYNNLKVKILDSVEQIDNLNKALNCSESFVVDIESKGLRHWDEILGISFCMQDNQAYYVPFIDYTTDKQEVKVFPDDVYSKIVNNFKETFNNYKGWIIGHNIKFDLSLLAYQWGISTHLNLFDTFICHYLFNENMPHGLKAITNLLFTDIGGYEDALNKYKKDNKIRKELMIGIPKEILGLYCGYDSIATFKLAKYLLENMTDSMKNRYYNFYTPLISPYIKCEHNGVGIDFEYVKKLREVYEARAKRYKYQIINDLLAVNKKLKAKISHEMNLMCLTAKSTEEAAEIRNKFNFLMDNFVGEDFNPFSHPQTSQVLYNQLGYEISKRSKLTGDPSVDKPTLIRMIGEKDNPILRNIIMYRNTVKFISTYIDGLDKALGADNRVHFLTNLTGTVSARISINNFPIQTVPRLAEVRAIFMADKDRVITQGDYSMLEIRMAAYLADDKQLINDLINKVDIHTKRARQCFSLNEEATVLKFQRDTGKSVNFGNLYGAGDDKLAEIINKGIMDAMLHGDLLDDTPLVTPEIAGRGKRGFFNDYPKIRSYIEQMRTKLMKDKQAVTVFGHTRRLPMLQYGNEKHDIEAALREGVNQFVQGPASDICQMAFKRIYYDHILKDKKNWIVLFTKHDAIYIEHDKEDTEEVHKVMREEMLRPIPELPGIELDVDIKTGPRWADIPDKFLEEYKNMELFEKQSV